MENKIVHVSFHCYFKDGGKVKHYQDIQLKDISRWIEAYKFTHPDLTEVSIMFSYHIDY